MIPIKYTPIRLAISLLVIALVSPSLKGEYKIFYYKNKNILEKRLEFFLKNPGLLANYPVSQDAEEQELEELQSIKYAKNIDSDMLEQDIEKALKEKSYYGLVRIFASIDKPDLALKSLNKIGGLLGEDKYANAICAYAVQRLVRIRLLKEKDEKPNFELGRAFTRFIFLLRKKGFDAKGYDSLKNIDNQLYEGVLHTYVGN